MQNLLRCVFVVVLADMAVVGYGGETVAFSAHSSDPDNIITNDVHYAKPIAQIAADDVVRYWSEYGNIKIRVPEDVTFASTFDLSFYTGKGKRTDMIIDGVWYMPDGSIGYPEYHMEVTSVLSLRLANRTRGPFRFQDGTLSFSKTADGAVTTLEWNGDFNFYDPNGGTPLYDNYLYANQTGVGHSRYVFSGGTFSVPIIWDYGESLTNDFLFTGGHHFIRRLMMRNHNSITDDYPRTRILVSGPDTVLKLYNFETQSSETTHGYSACISNNATLEFTGSFAQGSGKPFGFVFDHANLVVTNQAANDSYWRNPRIAATNALFSMATRPGSSGENNRLNFTGEGQMILKDTTFNGYCTVFDTDMVMEGGAYTASYGTKVGGSYGQGTVIFRNVSADFGTDMELTVGTGSNDRSKLVIDGSTAATARHILCGNTGTADSTFEIRSGSMTVSNRVILGGSGNGTLHVVGGKMSAKNIYSAWNDVSNGRTGTVIVAGGELTVSDGINYSIAGGATACRGVTILTGGTLKTAFITCSDNGTAAFVADGGTICPTTANADLIRKMVTARLGSKGLTVEADKDIVISQSFTNLDEADGQLILTGSGTKTLSGTATTVSKIVVAGGTLVFAEDAKAASTLIVTNGATVKFAGDPSAVGLTGFVCGEDSSAGVLALSSSQTLAIAGSVTLNDIRLALLDDEPLDTARALLTATVTPSPATCEAWRDARIVAGRDVSRSYDFTVEGHTAGVTAFRMSVATSAYQAVLENGSSNVVDDISVGVCARILAQVAEGASLTFSGSVGNGALQKTGAGRLYLTSSDNAFLSGVTSEGGLLSVSSAAALGAVALSTAGVTLQDGTLEFSSHEADIYDASITVAAAEKKPVVVKTDGDLTVAGFTVSTGDFIKRGVGTLTIAPPSGTSWTLSADDGAMVPPNDWDPGDVTPIAFADDGTVPDHGYLGFNVAEGEVVLKGDATTCFTAAHSVLVGPSVSSCDAVQTLTVDGAKAVLAKYKRLFVGAYTRADAPVKARAAAFKVVNGADVTVNTFVMGRGLGAPNASTCLVDNATLRTGSFRPAYYWAGKPQVIVRNGGRVFLSDLYQSGPSSIAVAGGVFARNEAGNGFAAAITGSYGGTWRFSEGAYFACHTISFSEAFNQYHRLTLEFEGATWSTCDNATQTFHLYQASNLVIRTIATAGLSLPVAADQTVSVARAITGPGGVVKTGAGTLRFETQGTWDSARVTKTSLEDPISLAFEDSLDVREGTVTIDQTACRTGGVYKAASGASIDFGANQLGAATFAGSGSFANGVTAAAVIAAPLADDGTLAAYPSFTAMTLSSVRVDFGRTVALEQPAKGIIVATFPNGAPDVSGWRGRNMGEDRRATFRIAANGQDVLADVTRVGFVLIVR